MKRIIYFIENAYNPEEKLCYRDDSDSLDRHNHSLEEHKGLFIMSNVQMPPYHLVKFFDENSASNFLVLALIKCPQFVMSNLKVSSYIEEL